MLRILIAAVLAEQGLARVVDTRRAEAGTNRRRVLAQVMDTIFVMGCLSATSLIDHL